MPRNDKDFGEHGHHEVNKKENTKFVGYPEAKTRKLRWMILIILTQTDATRQCLNDLGVDRGCLHVPENSTRFIRHGQYADRQQNAMSRAVIIMEFLKNHLHHFEYDHQLSIWAILEAFPLQRRDSLISKMLRRFRLLKVSRFASVPGVPSRPSHYVAAGRNVSYVGHCRQHEKGGNSSIWSASGSQIVSRLMVFQMATDKKERNGVEYNNGWTSVGQMDPKQRNNSVALSARFWSWTQSAVIMSRANDAAISKSLNRTANVLRMCSIWSIMLPEPEFPDLFQPALPALEPQRTISWPLFNEKLSKWPWISVFSVCHFSNSYHYCKGIRVAHSKSGLQMNWLWIFRLRGLISSESWITARFVGIQSNSILINSILPLTSFAWMAIQKEIHWGHPNDSHNVSPGRLRQSKCATDLINRVFGDHWSW
jgi:hypothetical protein